MVQQEGRSSPFGVFAANLLSDIANPFATRIAGAMDA